MESSVHRSGVKRVTQKFARCKKEVTLENRRVDLQCNYLNNKVNVEVKRNFKDYNSKRSQKQIKEMTKSSNKKNQAQITLISKPFCFIGQNNLGKNIILDKNLSMCKILS